MSSEQFPIGILYQSTKLVYEIPKGIRENLLRIYSGFNQDEYDNEVPAIEKQLTFHLAFFHALVLERLQFGSIGWNIPYEFNPSDFSISKRQLHTFLSESSVVPYEALTYVIGELNYGGRVTDQWDRRLLISLLQRYFSEGVNSPGFTFGPKYPIPLLNSPLSALEESISKWPVITAGEDVCLSLNASTITARNDAICIFNSMIEIQPTLVSIQAVSEEQFALSSVDSLLEQIPKQFNLYGFNKKFKLEDAVTTVLYHELLLYNKLLSVISSSLIELQRGLKGLVVIDDRLDQLNRRILANRIPEEWFSASYPSILTLHSYIKDLQHRIEFLDNWVKFGQPISFELGAFYHPEEFLTAILQVHARKSSIPFDSLAWNSEILDGKISHEPEFGVYVTGLYIEGAKWDVVGKTLTECGQTELISNLPTIHLIPTTEKMNREDVYECPVYRTQSRGSGAIGLPNFIMSVNIPSKNQEPEHWIQRSVAVIITV